MKNIALLISFLGCLHICYGQTNKAEITLSSIRKVDLGLQGIGFTYERRISNRITTDFSAGLGGGYDIAEGSIKYQPLKPAVYFSVTPKYFYNLEKRASKGKSAQNNSGNYLGTRFTFNAPVFSKSDIIRNSVLANIHWGMQRAVSSHWTVSSHAGVGYAHDIDYDFGTVYPAFDLKFSYIL